MKQQYYDAWLLIAYTDIHENLNVLCGEVLTQVKDENVREVEFFDSIMGDDVIPFMSNIGYSVGISNSLVLYEKVFIVVEGESEESALPILQNPFDIFNYNEVKSQSKLEPESCRTRVALPTQNGTFLNRYSQRYYRRRNAPNRQIGQTENYWMGCFIN